MAISRRHFLAASGLGVLAAACEPWSMVRRLILATHGGGSVVIPPASSTVTLTSAPEGGWSWFEDPRAVAHGVYTYIGYIDSSGNVKIAVARAGAVVATSTLHTALEVDDHDSPTLHVRADGKLIAFYSKHVGANIYRRISSASLDTDPTLTSGFGTEASLSSTFGASASTYPSPTYLSNVDASGDRLFLFWRETDGTNQGWYAVSSDDGDTWSAGIHLHNITYTKTAPNGTARWDVACSDHGSVATKIYHLYREAAAWHQSDGTTIGGGLPIAAASMTTVYDAGTDHVWISDIAIDGSNNPIIVFVTWPSNDYTDSRYMYAVWTGAAWDVNEIVAAGGWLPSSVEYPPGTFQYQYSGGVILDHADPQIVYCSREVSAGVFEIFRYVTSDGGSSFTATQLTTDLTKSARPVSVINQYDIATVWLYGTYTDYVTWSMGLRAFAP